MEFLEGNIYHIYNRGNDSMNIFFNARNYLFFLDKVAKHICKHSELLAYCLMPNHFHFMVYIKEGPEPTQLNNEIAILLRSYTRAINEQENRTGSLFQQKTKAKNVTEHSLICLNYIHQNPLRAGLTSNLEDWLYSSYREYLGTAEENYANIDLARKLLQLPGQSKFVELSNEIVNDKRKSEIFL